jgi:hypothetical protein
MDPAGVPAIVDDTGLDADADLRGALVRDETAELGVHLGFLSVAFTEAHNELRGDPLHRENGADF